MDNKLREEIDDKYKWDLSTIYSSTKELEEDYNKIKEDIKKLKKQSKTFCLSGENLYNYLKLDDSLTIILEKMYTYTSHNYDTNLSNNKNQMYKEKIEDLFDEYSNITSFEVPTILENEDKIDLFYKECPKLKEEYSFLLETILRYKPHTLTKDKEEVIAALYPAISNTEDIASMLTSSDLNFGTIKDENGKEVSLTDTNYPFFLESKDRRVRKDAFYTLYKTYKQFNNTFALSLSKAISKRVAIAKLRNYEDALSSALYADNVPKKVYNNLVKIISDNLEPLYDYYRVKQKLLGIDDAHMYDIYAEVVKKPNTKYTFDKAKELVLESLSILGEDYIKNLNKAFTEKWIDIYPNKGKRGGAYSGGSYLTNPFVLLNFNGTYRDISTLAHELGHSMHTYYSNQNNPYQYADYKIFVAEVASQVNELLLDNYMLNKVETKEEKLDILNQILDLFRGSIYRQTMFSEFEENITKEKENGEVLTADKMNNIYYNLVKKYFGDSVIIDEEIKYEWCRIPHFYYNFYVYKYSVGLAAAAYIVNRIINKEEGAVADYLAFLKTGGSDYPLNELKVAGVSLEDPIVIESAIDTFKKYLEKFKELVR